MARKEIFVAFNPPILSVIIEEPWASGSAGLIDATSNTGGFGAGCAETVPTTRIDTHREPNIVRRMFFTLVIRLNQPRVNNSSEKTGSTYRKTHLERRSPPRFAPDLNYGIVRGR